VADWVSISSLATAGGTLVLAVATFAAVRSANRSARVAERAFAATLRPVLVTARADDPELRVPFTDGHRVVVQGVRAAAETDGATIWLALALRNVGSGLAVLDRWAVEVDWERRLAPPRDPDAFRRLTRDLYVAPGDVGFWQGAIRDAEDGDREAVRDAIAARRPFAVDVLYSDHEGGQRTVTRFGVLPKDDGDGWAAAIARHWNLDRDDPR
jgi:hypothetical protein